MTLAGTAEPLRILLVVEMTERKLLESRLLQAQKMDAVGRLAGGVAHDFNNSLGVILGYAELLIPETAEAQRGKLEQILKATNRAAGLTRPLTGPHPTERRSRFSDAGVCLLTRLREA